MSLSKFTSFFAIYIIISSYFMQDVWATWKAVFGRPFLILFFVFLCLVATSAILYQSKIARLNIRKIILIFIICIGGFIFAWRQPYLPEKAHVLEFGLLGWLAIRDLTEQSKNSLKSILAAFVFVVIIGCLEEGFQKLLPWRVFEIRDILTDALSGMLGIILYQLSQARLSAFIRPF